MGPCSPGARGGLGARIFCKESVSTSLSLLAMDARVTAVPGPVGEGALAWWGRGEGTVMVYFMCPIGGRFWMRLPLKAGAFTPTAK